ncbi:MAG: hypothetical protein OSB57_14840, partial [Planctomycetota bacterium]|nr:hypothetical protein [Planctomycetota bacterium]
MNVPPPQAPRPAIARIQGSKRKTVAQLKAADDARKMAKLQAAAIKLIAVQKAVKARAKKKVKPPPRKKKKKRRRHMSEESYRPPGESPPRAL